MKEPIFAGTAAVELQGPRALEFVSINRKQAEFDVIGISNPKIRVIDLRPAVMDSMNSILETKRVEELVDYFNQPAFVTLYPEEADQITIMLEETQAKKPSHILWIATGLDTEIPFYCFEQLEIRFEADDKIALFSLYENEQA